MTVDTQLVFDGQSLVFAPYLAVAPNVATSLASSLVRKYGLATPARGATTYATRNASVVARVDGLLGNANSSVLIDIGGTSDLQAGVSAATLLSTVETYADARRVAGFSKVIELTVPSYAGITGPADTQRLAYNAALVANANGKFDAVVDVAGDPILSDNLDATYYEDGTHWTAAGAAVAAGLVESALVPLGVS